MSKIIDITNNITDGIHGDCENEANSGYYFISVKDLYPYEINYQNARQITAKDFFEANKRTKLEKGDVLFANSGDTIGKMLFVKETNVEISKTTFQKSIAILKPNPDKIDPTYFYYLIKFYTLGLRQSAVGSAQKNLLLSSIRDFKLKINHELLIQKNVVRILGFIDSKIELNNKINSELEAMAKTLYDYWFVQFDFPDKDGKPYKTSGGRMVWNDELKREIPDGWEVGTLLSLGEIIGGSTPPREINEYFTENGTAWITPKDLSLNTGNKFISKGELDVSDKGIKTASLNVMPKGTVLLSSRAPVGYLAISRETVTTNQGFKSFVPNNGYPTEFIYYSIKNMIPTIENNAVGSTFKEVSASTLKTIKICLPDKVMVKKYADIAKNIFNKQDCLELENQTLSNLRDWLLPMLMNGQVTIHTD